MYQNEPHESADRRGSPVLLQPEHPQSAKQGGEPKYSVTLLIPKSDAATKADIDAAIQGRRQ